MNLQNFPMDTQICPMLFESCEYCLPLTIVTRCVLLLLLGWRDSLVVIVLD